MLASPVTSILSPNDTKASSISLILPSVVTLTPVELLPILVVSFSVITPAPLATSRSSSEV